MVLHLTLFLTGFAMSWLAVWAALDIHAAGGDPSDEGGRLVVPAATAVGAGLWATSIVFALATGRPLAEGVTPGTLALDSLAGLLATWLTLGAMRRGGRWAGLLAALAMGTALVVVYAKAGYTRGVPPFDITLSGLFGAGLAYLGILASARLRRWCGASPGVRRGLTALVLGTALAAAQLAVLLGLPVQAVLPAAGLQLIFGLRARVLLVALLTVGLLSLVDIEVRRHHRQHWLRFGLLVQDSLDLVLVVGSDGGVRYASPSAKALTGREPEELLGSPLADLLDPEDRLPASDGRVALRLRCAGGEPRQFAGTLAAGRHRGERILHLVDVSERVAARREAEVLAEWQEHILRAIGEGLFGLDGAGRVTFVNDAALALVDRPREQVIGQRLEAILPHVDPDGSAVQVLGTALRGARGTGATQRGAEPLRLVRRGAVAWVEVTVAPMRWQNAAAGTVALFVDVTERRRSEAEQRQVAERFVQTLDAIGDAVVAEDARGRVLYVNRAAREVLGIALGDRHTDEGLLFGKLRIEDWRGATITARQGLLRANALQGQVTGHVERAFVRPDGRRVLGLVEAVPWRAETGEPGVLYVMRDVTEIRKAEEERRRVRRLESLGVFAGGIAHDFNNALTVVLGNVALARSGVAPGSASDALLQSAERACRQAAGLTGRLLTFARGGAPVTGEVCLRGILKEAVAHALQGTGISAGCDLAPDLWPIQADADQIHDVVTNLLRNAAQAMPDGGAVEVRAENLCVRAGQLPPLGPGCYVHLQVLDHGPGIPPEDLDRVFEPYFTTRPEGHGLGLATCWSIVRRHGGHIAVQSRPPGEGAAIDVYLPRAHGGLEAPPAPAAADTTPRRILLMDDEQEILAVSGETLRRMGHRVTVARDGDEALVACREALQAGQGFDLAILDLTIPGGMGGREAAERLAALDPALRLIASSGYSNAAVMGDYEAFGFAGVLPKPYRRQELAAAIAAALRSGGAPADAPPRGASTAELPL